MRRFLLNQFFKLIQLYRQQYLPHLNKILINFANFLILLYFLFGFPPKLSPYFPPFFLPFLSQFFSFSITKTFIKS